MPYRTIDSPNLPEYVKNKPESIRKKWVTIFNAVVDSEGEDAALLAANSWLKRELDTQSSFLKRSVIKFDVDTSSGFIKRSDDNEDYVTLVLNTTESHRDGKKFSPGLLQKWADSINNNPIVGDIDHELFDKVLSSVNSDAAVQGILKSKKGIAKTLKAIYENGKLWVRAIIDKRYKKVIENSKGVSVEAFITEKTSNDEILDADLLGFTFNINTTPADYGAGVV